ncbi:MAG: carbonic anhydrase family protein [Methylotenera sp.]|nr:carbonic anhydrase family protein [Methylotenera sp.]MDO9233548.1 carbonic anhydrase family protein [Methylotenera sp.]MDP2103121.1 carbonic anhydrase family protein [Methylotenera sp.]MDP2280080.1 carbonic anhydrase family protein [Methylotenera sp.]MDP2403588.1 carbonic anhydrase family protein [Methylotenera sp.]
MQKIIIALLLYFSIAGNGMAAVWVKVNENNISKLSVDKQSILQKEQLTRAWIKIEYKTPQKNIESPDKEYDLSKLLWYFNCAEQKSATSQVFQYLNAQLIYSAGIDAKGAEFIEPVPETDFDLAMRYVCSTRKPVKIPSSTTPASPTKPTTKPEAVNNPAPGVAVAAENSAPVEPAPQNKSEPAQLAKAKEKSEKPVAYAANWTYEGKEGPENWGKLKPEFVTCNTGRNQSPINIEDTVDASMKPLKLLQKFPVKDIVNNGHTVQANFKVGNILAIDNMSFQLKHVQFRAPSENTIKGKSFPLEAHFVHADAKGNLSIIAVMFKEGKSNIGLEKLWKQIPNDIDKPVNLKSRVLASEMVPDNQDYYRFSGSLTTPPCSEGVRWLLIKTPMTASNSQIEAFKSVLKRPNNRPVQPLNGRVIIE